MNFTRFKKYLVPGNYIRYVRLRCGPKYKRSYSQNGEDRLLWFIFRALGISKPSYIDIGAHDPFSYSNTALLYENGSTGINIEPDPRLFKRFLKKRKRDVNLNIGVAEAGGTLDFYVMSGPALSTFSKTEAERLVREYGFTITQTLPIEVKTVAEVIRDYAGGVFPDLLSIDIEGLDETILRSMDFTASRPKVICVETISYSPTRDGIKNRALIKFLESKGYLLLADTYINSLFVDASVWNSPTQ
ncbi:MAG: FkbM family methyltransferase [Patescibacteria group bacterium]|nr:FkbM family methyltransferase [Patescibacteria group bacterium]